jgi:nucleoid-associated protein YejK
MNKSIKNFLLESESEKDDNFIYIKGDTISKVIDVDFNKGDDYIKISFLTTYKKKYSFLAKLSDFKKWLNSNKKEKAKSLFHDYLKNFFEVSKEVEIDELNEIIDDTNEIMPDQDLPSNSTNRMVGANHTMDLEKVFKKSMPQSIRNYSGNLGLGSVVW